MAIGIEELSEEPGRRRPHLSECGAGDEVARVAVGVGEGMDRSGEVSEPVSLLVEPADEVGLVEGPAVPDRHGNKGELASIGDEWIATDPSRLDLARDKQGSDFLIGAARYQVYGPIERARKIGLQLLSMMRSEVSRT